MTKTKESLLERPIVQAKPGVTAIVSDCSVGASITTHFRPLGLLLVIWKLRYASQMEE